MQGAQAAGSGAGLAGSDMGGFPTPAEGPHGSATVDKHRGQGLRCDANAACRARPHLEMIHALCGGLRQLRARDGRVEAALAGVRPGQGRHAASNRQPPRIPAGTCACSARGMAQGLPWRRTLGCCYLAAASSATDAASLPLLLCWGCCGSLPEAAGPGRAKDPRGLVRHASHTVADASRIHLRGALASRDEAMHV